MASVIVLDVFYGQLFEFFTVNGAPPFVVEMKPTSKEIDRWGEAEGHASSSTFTSPLLFDIVLSLRSLNRAWLARFNIFTHISEKKLTDFDFSFFGPNPSKSSHFSVELSKAGPPSKYKLAEKAADAHLSAFMDGAGIWQQFRHSIVSTIAQTGTYNAEEELGLSGAPEVTLKYAVVLPPQEFPEDANPVERLNKTELGKRLLGSVETLTNLSYVWESDTEAVWPQAKHDHMVRCFKFLALAAHNKFEKLVDISIKGGYSYEGMGSSNRNDEFFIERKDLLGQKFWLKIKSGSSCFVEM